MRTVTPHCKTLIWKALEMFTPEVTSALWPHAVQIRLLLEKPWFVRKLKLVKGAWYSGKNMDYVVLQTWVPRVPMPHLPSAQSKETRCMQLVNHESEPREKWAEHINRQYTEKIKLVAKYLKRCITMKYDTYNQINRNLKIWQYQTLERIGLSEHFYTVIGNINW